MHQKRLSAKQSYRFKRKVGKRFLVCPKAGPNPKDESIPLLSFLRDMIGYCENAREALHIIKKGGVFVDGKARKDHRYPVGIFDVVTLPEINQSFRVIPGEKFLEVVKTDEKNLKLCMIRRKTMVKGGKLQLNLHDGKNIIVSKNDYRTGDSVLLGLPKLEIKKHLKRQKDALCLVIRGSNRGKMGKLRELRKTIGPKTNLASMEIDQKIVEIPEKFIFVVGDKNPEIKLGE